MDSYSTSKLYIHTEYSRRHPPTHQTRHNAIRYKNKDIPVTMTIYLATALTHPPNFWIPDIPVNVLAPVPVPFSIRLIDHLGGYSLPSSPPPFLPSYILHLPHRSLKLFVLKSNIDRTVGTCNFLPLPKYCPALAVLPPASLQPRPRPGPHKHFIYMVCILYLHA